MGNFFNQYLGPLDAASAVGSALVVGISGLVVRIGRIRRGRPERRHARWFLEKYSTYWSLYLDATERLHLDRTYIPMSFVQGAAPGGLVAETTALADRLAGNMVVLGDAGSGKTTMFKAFGVSALQSSGPGRGDVPFFVP